MKDLLTGLKNRRGSFAIFAVMAFSAMLVMLSAAIKSSGDMAVSSVTCSFGSLWGKSILSEYDIYLNRKYGIFAFYGNEVSMEEKLNYYARYSFSDKAYVNYQGSECYLEGYNLADIKNFKEQVEDIVRTGYTPASKKATSQQEENSSERAIISQWIIKSLPSYGKTEEAYIYGLISKIKAGVGIGNLLGNLATDRYIFAFFKDYMDSRDLGDTYFNCEIEYIISGKPSDRDARRDTERKIKSLRNMLNLYYLYTCPEKREGAMALASAVTPGPAALLTQAAILEIWAYAEAENDMKILYDKKTVPLLKNDSNWALSLENVFNTEADSMETIEKNNGEGKKQTSYIAPQVVRGENYAEYLGVILCGIPEDTKLLRIMDLIQINMKYLYCDYFNMTDYNVGLKYEIKVNGEFHEFEESYRQKNKR